MSECENYFLLPCHLLGLDAKQNIYIGSIQIIDEVIIMKQVKKKSQIFCSVLGHLLAFFGMTSEFSVDI